MICIPRLSSILLAVLILPWAMQRERVPNMDLSFRLESSELCWKDTHTILNKNLKCLRLGSARPFSFMLFVVCSTYYIATQWRWIIFGQGGSTPPPTNFGRIVSKTFMIAGWSCAQRHCLAWGGVQTWLAPHTMTGRACSHQAYVTWELH